MSLFTHNCWRSCRVKKEELVRRTGSWQNPEIGDRSFRTLRTSEVTAAGKPKSRKLPKVIPASLRRLQPVLKRKQHNIKGGGPLTLSIKSWWASRLALVPHNKPQTPWMNCPVAGRLTRLFHHLLDGRWEVVPGTPGYTRTEFLLYCLPPRPIPADCSNNEHKQELCLPLLISGTQQQQLSAG